MIKELVAQNTELLNEANNMCPSRDQAWFGTKGLTKIMSPDIISVVDFLSYIYYMYICNHIHMLAISVLLITYCHNVT